MKRYGLGISFSSILILLYYTGCALLAYFSYPLAYSPARNWLSDLGSRVLNPNGAIFYNTGIIITAIWLLFFFFGISGLKTGSHKIQALMIRLAQLFGVLASISMILSAFYPIDMPRFHSLFSGLLYASLGTAIAFSAAAMRYEARCPKWLFVLGCLAALFDLLTSLLFNTIPIFEWITVSFFLAYIACLGISMSNFTIRFPAQRPLSQVVQK